MAANTGEGIYSVWVSERRIADSLTHELAYGLKRLLTDKGCESAVCPAVGVFRASEYLYYLSTASRGMWDGWYWRFEDAVFRARFWKELNGAAWKITRNDGTVIAQSKG